MPAAPLAPSFVCLTRARTTPLTACACTHLSMAMSNGPSRNYGQPLSCKAAVRSAKLAATPWTWRVIAQAIGPYHQYPRWLGVVLGHHVCTHPRPTWPRQFMAKALPMWWAIPWPFEGTTRPQLGTLFNRVHHLRPSAMALDLRHSCTDARPLWPSAPTTSTPMALCILRNLFAPTLGPGALYACGPLA